MEYKKIRPLDKKGVVGGMRIVQSVMIIFLILAVIAVAILLATVSLRDSGIFDAGTSELNRTTAIVENVSIGVTDFFANTSTIFSILVVVIIILAIAIVVAVVSRFGGGRSATTV